MWPVVPRTPDKKTKHFRTKSQIFQYCSRRDSIENQPLGFVAPKPRRAGERRTQTISFCPWIFRLFRYHAGTSKRVRLDLSLRSENTILASRGDLITDYRGTRGKRYGRSLLKRRPVP